MAVGKPFSIDKTDTAREQLTKLDAFKDFCVFIGLCAAYIIQVSWCQCFKETSHQGWSDDIEIFSWISISNWNNWLKYFVFFFDMIVVGCHSTKLYHSRNKSENVNCAWSLEHLIDYVRLRRDQKWNFYWAKCGLVTRFSAVLLQVCLQKLWVMPREVTQTWNLKKQK